MDEKEPGTIKSYATAIKSILASENIQISHDAYKLSALVRVCRLKKDKQSVAMQLPILKNLHDRLLDHMREYFMQKGQLYLATLCQVLILTGYYGLLRVGEMTLGTHPILACNMQRSRNRQKFQMVLKTSKNHSVCNPLQRITIFSELESNRFYCPYHIITDYIELREKRNGTNIIEPFFVFRNRQPVKPEHFHKVLKRSLDAQGLNSNNYNCHSLRNGKASDLFKSRMEYEQIKVMGRWHSNSTCKYLRQ